MVRSLPLDHKVPGSIHGSAESGIFGDLLSAKVHSAFHPSEVGKRSTQKRLEFAPVYASSPLGVNCQLIIVKRL